MCNAVWHQQRRDSACLGGKDAGVVTVEERVRVRVRGGAGLGRRAGDEG